MSLLKSYTTMLIFVVGLFAWLIVLALLAYATQPILIRTVAVVLWFCVAPAVIHWWVWR